MTLKPDMPIHNIDSDKLRRYDFAQTITKTLLNVSQNNNCESFVFGLYGKWGSGKTSLINLIKLSLQQSIETKTDSLKWTSFAGFCNKIFNFISKFLLAYILFTFSFTEFVLSTNFGYNIINSFSSIFINILDIISVIEWLTKITFILYIMLMKPFNLNFLLTLIKNIINNIRNILIRNDSKSQNQEPIIVNFSPWNTTSKETLLKDFFETLRNKIDETHNNPMYSSVITAIDNYSKNLCYSFFRGIFQDSSNSDIASLKTNLEEQLFKLNRKIIIFIDDIDRLSTDEIFLLFKLIKSVANFLNIIYFLSFDKEVVVNALDNYSNGKGEEFLEKIIQVPINLPQININDYQAYLIQGFNDFISIHPQIEKDWNEKYQDYWNLTAHNGFLKLFNNPRDVIRYFNTLEIAYNPKIHGEVNIIDFMIIIALQLFYPQLYEFISKNEELFLISPNQYNNNEDKNEIKIKLNKLLESYSPSLRKDFEQLIANLFPYSQVYKTFNLSCETIETRKKNGRICCREHFHKFFTYNIDENVISLNQMKDVLNSIEDIADFSNKLLDLNTQGKIKNFLEQLENYIDDISCKNVENIIKALFNLGDYFDLSDEGFWAFDIYVNIDRITYQLLQKKELDNQLGLLKACITNNQSIYPAINYINLIKSALTKNKGEIELNYINFDEYQDLAQCLTLELYKWAENDLNSNNDKNKPFNGCLIKHRKALSLLYFWYDIGDKQRLKDYLNALTQENTGLIEFLHILKRKIRSSSGVRYNEYYKIQKEELLTFLGDVDIHERLNQIDRTLLPSNDKEVIELTLKALSNNDDDF